MSKLVCEDRSLAEKGNFGGQPASQPASQQHLD